MKIKNKITINILFFGILFIAGLAFTFYVSNRSIVTQHFEEHSIETAKQAAYYVNLLLIEKSKNSAVMANAPIVKDELIKSNLRFSSIPLPERTQKIADLNQIWMDSDNPQNPVVKSRMANSVALYLDSLKKNMGSEIGEIFLTNKYGVVVATTNKLTTLAHSHKYWWKASYYNSKGRIFFDDRGFDESVDGYVVGIVVPVYDNKEIIGILKVNYNIINALGNLVKRLKLPTSNIKICRSNGVIVYEHGKVPLSTKLDLTCAAKLNSDDNFFIYDNDEHKSFVAFTPIPITKNSSEYGFGGSYQSIDHIQGNVGESWYILIEEKVNTMLAPLQKIAKWFIAISLSSLCIIIFFGFLFAKKISQPIISLIRNTEKLGKGDLSVRSEVKSNDELELLAYSIDNMAHDLSIITSSRDELNKEITIRKKGVRELKKTQEMLHTVIDTMPLFLFWKDLEGNYLGANQKFIEFAGFKTLQQLVGKSDYDLPWSREDIEKYRIDDLEVIKTNKPKLFIEERVLAKDGSEKWVLTSKAPLNDENGNVVGVLGIFQDITERKINEGKMQKYAEKQKILLSEVNHRVKNNLAATIGMLHVEQMRFADAGKEELVLCLDGLEGCLQSLSTVHSMLAQSNWEPLRVDQLCNSIVTQVLNSLSKEKKCNLKIEKTSAFLDSEQAHHLVIIINELVTNTIKHCFQDREVEHNISISFPEDKELFVIKYADNGVGFPEAILNDITKSKTIGLGLITGMVRQSLGGECKFYNDNGAVIEMRIEQIKSKRSPST